MSDVVYVHYGSAVFDNSKFREIDNDCVFNKPLYGFWACRENADCNWPDSINDTKSIDELVFIKFTLCRTARILYLSSVEDVLDVYKKYPLASNKFIHNLNDSLFSHHIFSYKKCMIDWTKVAEDYDAVELVDISSVYYHLYGWDLNSICVFNPAVIVC